MKHFLQILGGSTLLAIIVFLGGVQSVIVKAKDAIPGRYIVVLKDNAARKADDTASPSPAVSDIGKEMSTRHGIRIRNNFEHVIQGFAIEANDEQVKNILKDPHVEYIEEDGVVKTASRITQTNPPSWGLDRIDQRTLPLDAAYAYDGNGAGVDVYVVDSGIRSTHSDFGGRVNTAVSYTAISDGYGTEDCFGHGTFVSGIIGGNTYGVAKGATLHPVRIFGCSGTGATSDLIAGIDWITSLYPSPTPKKGKPAPPSTSKPPAIVNMSIESAQSVTINTAVKNSIAAGITYVVAAGNGNGDACQYSPAGLTEAITVGATNISDARYSYSNWGICLDLFAPGVNITSDFNRSDTDTLAITGTSASTPHATGVAALYLGENPTATPYGVGMALISAATKNQLTDLGNYQSPNRLVYSLLLGTDLAPVADFSYTCSNGRCNFNGNLSWDDYGIASYAWDFGDGSMGSGIQPRHNYRNPGGFNVGLTVTDTSGQQSTVQKYIVP